MKTKPEVFIVESLGFNDEKHQRYEGDIIKRILSFSGKDCQYFYVRTERELRVVLRKFEKSNYRYLHLSCHGSKDAMFTTLDNIDLESFAKVVNPYIKNRRLFISACSLTNRSLAKRILPDSQCHSVLGPATDVAFSDAAILWATLYHTMFAKDDRVMKRAELTAQARSVATLFRVPLNLYTRAQNSLGFDEVRIKPA